ncbi:MAG TPA: protein kinase [Polyangiaceae bacterium]
MQINTRQALSQLSVDYEDDRFDQLLQAAAHASNIPLHSPAAGPLLSAGTRLFEGRFTIRRRIGEGGMGIVYEAFDATAGRAVALKVVARADPASLFRFKNEFRALADVVHPHLVRLHGLFFSESNWFFTMDLIRGHDFVEHVRRSGHASNDSLRAALLQLVDGVRAIHRAGKLHRDLKPSNVLVTDQGQVIIVDFGLVSDEPSQLADVEPDRSLVGTPAYMSPERADGAPATAASDWYSVGVMLHEALGGRSGDGAVTAEIARASADPDASQVSCKRPLEAPHDLGELCRALLNCDPARRPTGDEIWLSLVQGSEMSSVECFDNADAQRCAPFVGRSKELAALWSAVPAAQSGKLAVCYVRGSSGLGKTALIREFLAQAREAYQPVVLHGRCYERESMPYKLLDGVLDSLATKLVNASSGASGREALELTALTRLFPCLAHAAASSTSTDRRSSGAREAELRKQAVQELRRALAWLARDTPLLIHIDDVQWADQDGCELLGELLEQDLPLLLVLSYRNDDISPDLERRLLKLRKHAAKSRRLTLGALRSGEIRRLTESLASSGRPVDVSAVIREAHGSPYFALELVRYVQAGGSEAALPARGSNAQKRCASGLATLEDALLFRFRSLPSDARRVLEATAVFGAPIDRDVLSSAVDCPDIDRVIALLKSASFVRTRSVGPREQVDTHHDHVREALTAQMSELDRRSMHHRLALALESRAAQQVELLATHFGQAGASQKTAEYACLAAERAASALAFEDSAAWFRKALISHAWEPATVCKLATRLAEVLALAGYRADAAAAYLQAASGATESDRLMLELEGAAQLVLSGEFEDGLIRLRSGLQKLGVEVPDQDDVWTAIAARVEEYKQLREQLRCGYRYDVSPAELARVDACWSTAAALTTVNLFGLVEYLLLHQLVEALRIREPLRIARGAYFLTGVVAGLQAGTYFESPSALTALADEAASQVDDPRLRFWKAASLSWQAYWDFDHDKTVRHNETARRLAGKGCYGVTRELVMLDVVVLQSLFYSGKIRAYYRSMKRICDDASRRRDDYAALWAELLDLRPFFDDQSERLIRRLKERLRSISGTNTKDSHPAFVGEMSLSLAERYAGDVQGARDRMRRLIHRVRQTVIWIIPRHRVTFLREAVGAAAAAGDWSEYAQELFAEWDDVACRIPALAASLHTGRAGIAWSRGDQARTLAELDRIVADEASELSWCMAPAAQVMKGIIVGGLEGEVLVRAGESQLRAAGMRNPRRIAHFVLPGFPDLR